ncbi:MAG: choline-sulfatase, partial [Paracoccaceae bacterium]
LYDLTNDPDEAHNIAPDPEAAEVLGYFTQMTTARWDLPAYDAEVRQSQARRWVVYPALRNGTYYPWDHQPLQKASERYMRNHMDLNVLEDSKRFPRGE